MRINNVASGRPTFYDRTPTAVNFTQTNFASAPAAVSTRISYTVPAGKKAQLDSLSLIIIRRSAATTPGISEAEVTFQPNGLSQMYMLAAVLTTNAVGDRATANQGASGVMLAGDQINVIAGSGDVGGTEDMFVGGKIVQFDA